MKVENCVRTSQRYRDAVAPYGPIVAAVSRNKPGAPTSGCIWSPVRKDMVILVVHRSRDGGAVAWVSAILAPALRKRGQETRIHTARMKKRGYARRVNATCLFGGRRVRGP